MFYTKKQNKTKKCDRDTKMEKERERKRVRERKKHRGERKATIRTVIRECKLTLPPTELLLTS